MFALLMSLTEEEGVTLQQINEKYCQLMRDMDMQVKGQVVETR